MFQQSFGIIVNNASDESFHVAEFGIDTKHLFVA